MSEAEQVFTAPMELSVRQIAVSVEAAGEEGNGEAAKESCGVAARARLELEAKTGKNSGRREFSTAGQVQRNNEK